MTELAQVPTKKLAERLLAMQRLHDKDASFIAEGSELRREALHKVQKLDFQIMRAKGDMESRQLEIDRLVKELGSRDRVKAAK